MKHVMRAGPAAHTLAFAPRLAYGTRCRYVRPMGSGADRLSGAIESVVSRFRTMVRGVGARRGLLDADLDEVLQDVRIRLWQAGQAGKDVEALGSSYLYQVATTAALDMLRRRRAHAADRTDDVSDRAELAASSPSPHDDTEANELAAQVNAALETLSLERRVVVRFHLSGHDREDIAISLGWSEAKTRNLLYRGLDDLRRCLASMGVAPTGRRRG